MFVELLFSEETFNAVLTFERFLIFMRIVMRIELLQRSHQLMAIWTLEYAVHVMHAGKVFEERLFALE